ncbi:hypothetical protein [Abyssalbus ytuae]|uniref:Glycerophosphoryl diester phosphodiesterase membrane domain-containing protein n=1 Tax=Abyssalbus ytuae TaxID=2926907 RepID=A0A9E7CTG3_9FLAO|nr:hypothetical protein [Abyssalbus ytuae]UOB18041.1 hypothetical protein MQE35_01775 [Abyssalbus ytuae]
MKQDYIELKVNRDFGDIISVYFDFFKQNIKKFTNIFINYNGIFLIALLIISYLLVSGFIGLITATRGSYNSSVIADESYLIYLIIGGTLFFVVFLVLAALNYGLSTSYMVNYENSKGNNFEKQVVWKLIKQKFGSIILFILLLIPIYIVFFIISMILAFIPLLGALAQYVISFFIGAWVGVSFFSMLYENRDVTNAYGEGWKLVTKNFWKSIGVNFILGLLIGLLLMIVLMIPGIIVGIYTFHAVQTDVIIAESVFAKVVYTFGTCLILITMVYSQCLSQFINGILFFNLHEKEYNINTRSKIEQIGQ